MVRKSGSFQHKNIVISTPDKKSWFSAMPAFGGRITHLVLHDSQNETVLLQGFENEVENDTTYKQAFLIPFANRINNGTFHFQGEQYQMKLNDLRQHHSVHGFLHSVPMEVREIASSFVTFEYNYKGDQPGYPFLFNTAIHYSIHPAKGFTCVVTIKNSGSGDMPLSVGWHPYFYVQNNVNEAQLRLPGCERCIVGNNNIPVGLYIKNEEFLNWESIGGKILNNCYKIGETPSISEIGLRYSNRVVTIWQESASFPFFQIYTPPDRRSIAIEPVSSCIDSFNNNDGLIMLKPMEEWKGMFGIKLQL